VPWTVCGQVVEGVGVCAQQVCGASQRLGDTRPKLGFEHGQNGVPDP
jgi:hypothetical protein